ncbi:MAG TPA: VCBS repeat-containing protein [Humisphaera sp.]|nr:VCBS repeat-containing protein [Humisphaera sp.]
MKKRIQSQRKLSTLIKAVTKAEYLEPRAYLSGVVFQTPGVVTNTTAAGISPVFATLFDFNGDGKDDLVVANSASNSVSVMLSNGDGSFGTADTIAVSGAPKPLIVAKVNGDSNFDIVSGNSTNVSVILGNGDGTFQPAVNIAGLSQNDAIGTGDFNGDGRTDIVVVNKNASAAVNDRVGILFQNGDGSFTLTRLTTITHTGLAAVATVDLNNDTHPDIALADQTDSKVTILINNGSGAFAAPVDYSTGSGPTSITAADFNNDSTTDLVTADSTGGAVSFLSNNGSGVFAAPVNSTVQGSPPNGGPLKVRLTNINADSNPDLTVLDGSGSTADATVLLGNGNGKFHTGTTIGNGSAFLSSRSIATGDLNNDGLTDAVVADPNVVTAYLNVTNTDTTAPTASVPATQPAPVAGATTYQFNVTYTDDNQIDAATIGDTNLTVTGPNGFSEQPTLVSQNLGNAASVTALYQITFPGGLSTTDNGVYTVTSDADGSGNIAVKDANGNSVAAGDIGTVTLNLTQIPPVLHGPNFTISAVTSKNHANDVAGLRGKTVKFQVNNVGDQVATKATLTFTLYASPTTSPSDVGAIALATITKKRVTIKIGKSKKYSFGKYTFPNVNGDFFLVVGVTADVGETSNSDNSGATATTINIQPPFIDLANEWDGVLPTTLPLVGKSFNLLVPVLNNGNVTAKGTVTLSLVLTSNGVDSPAIIENEKVSISSGKTRKLHFKVVVPTLATGTYSATLTVTPLSGFVDTNSTNDAVVSSNTVTV